MKNLVMLVKMGFHAVRCTLAAIRSAQEGRPAPVNEITPDYTAY